MEIFPWRIVFLANVWVYVRWVVRHTRRHSVPVWLTYVFATILHRAYTTHLNCEASIGINESLLYQRNCFPVKWIFYFCVLRVQFKPTKTRIYSTSVTAYTEGEKGGRRERRTERQLVNKKSSYFRLYDMDNDAQFMNTLYHFGEQENRRRWK